MSTEPIPYEGAIVAFPSRDYRWRRFGLVAILFLYGLYSLYDGFYRYPKENADFHRKNPLAEHLPHPAFDIPFNQAFGVGLPPLSLLFLAYIFYASRGTYRCDGTAVSVPGHDNIPLQSIVRIDKTKWDRKGIATIDYEIPGGASGTFQLDDFIYQRLPTDQIFAQIEQAIEGTPPAQQIESTPINLD